MKTIIQTSGSLVFPRLVRCRASRRLGCVPPGTRSIRWRTRSSLIQASMRDSSRSFSRKLRPSGISPRNFST